MRRFFGLLFAVAGIAHAGSDCEHVTFTHAEQCLNNHSWTHALNKKGATVYMRHIPGSARYELYMLGKVNAPASKIFSVLVDYDTYTDFMPETLTCSLTLDSVQGKKLVWQQIDFPGLLNLVVDDQYYLIEISQRDTRDRTESYRISWTLASEQAHQQHAPAEDRCRKGRKIGANEGYWEVEPDGQGASNVKYYLYTQPAGWAVEQLAEIVAGITRKEAPATMQALRSRVVEH